MMKTVIMLMAAFSSFYTTKLFLSPVYPLFLALLLVALIHKSYSATTAAMPRDCVILLVFLAYGTIGAVQSGQHAIPTYINLLTGAGAYIVIRTTPNMAPGFWLHSLKLSGGVVALLVTVDTAYRLTHPQHPGLEMIDLNEPGLSDNLFYFYKFGSLMFADSNTVGIILLLYLFTFVELRRTGRHVSMAWAAGFAILVLLTLSRSAILSMLAAGLLSMTRQKRHALYMLLAILAATACYALLFPPDDRSLLSKIDILAMMGSYYRGSSSPLVDVLFGVGMGQSLATLQIYSHVLVLTLLFECGLVGVLIYAYFIVYLLKRFTTVRSPLTGVLLASLSYFLYLGGPFFYVPLALLVNFEVSRKTMPGNIGNARSRRQGPVQLVQRSGYGVPSNFQNLKDF